jgi:hypothetical protein
VPASVDPGCYSTVILWWEAFAQFITVAKYRSAAGDRVHPDSGRPPHHLRGALPGRR